MSRVQPAIPVEDFVKAICTQLDRVQVMLAMKARAGLPLSFAVKDVSLQLRTHLESDGSEVRIRCAGPQDKDASTISFTFASIARSAMVENTEGILDDSDETHPDEDLENELSEQERRRLEWAGIRSARQLREVQQRAGEGTLRAVTSIPIERLRAALLRANRPIISTVRPDPLHPQSTPQAPVLRVSGRNLVREGTLPTVSIDSRRAAVIQSSDTELLIAPIEPVHAGVLSIETAAGLSAQTPLRISTEAAPHHAQSATLNGGRHGV